MSPHHTCASCILRLSSLAVMSQNHPFKLKVKMSTEKESENSTHTSFKHTSEVTSKNKLSGD